jgi:hypothetical protein
LLHERKDQLKVSSCLYYVRNFKEFSHLCCKVNWIVEYKQDHDSNSSPWLNSVK